MPNPLLITEKDFQHAVREFAEGCGWTIFTTWKSFNSPMGEPDLRMVRPPRVIFAELKSMKGKLTPAQADALALLSACPGVEAYRWTPADWPAIESVLE